MDYYTLTLCGLKRQLSIVSVSPQLKIASFNLLGDRELVSLIAKEIIERIKYFDFDILVGLEVKTLPLVYEISRILGKDRYVILRKQQAGYMQNPLRVGGPKGLVLDGHDLDLIAHKKIILLDDVVTSGHTINIAQDLIQKAEGQVQAIVAVIKQGEPSYQFGKPFFYLTTLPLFPNS
jgi:adenine phosphoribosyltransferase